MTPQASMDFAVGTPIRRDKSKVANKRMSIEAKHRIVVDRKNEKIRMMTDLVAEWDKLINETERDGRAMVVEPKKGDPGMTLTEGYDYLRDLKRRLRTAEAQKAAMRP